MIFRFSIIAALASLLGGCNLQTVSGSVAGGECKVFERPQYAVRGLRPYDQHWVNSQVEGGVGACGWARPAARPPELDAVRPVTKAVVRPVKKRGLIRRIKDRVTIWPDNPAPVVAAPLPVAETPAPAPAPAPPKPRSAIDELLHPSEPIRKVR
jgi:hypothetical protein